MRTTVPPSLTFLLSSLLFLSACRFDTGSSSANTQEDLDKTKLVKHLTNVPHDSTAKIAMIALPAVHTFLRDKYSSLVDFDQLDENWTTTLANIQSYETMKNYEFAALNFHGMITGYFENLRVKLEASGIRADELFFVEALIAERALDEMRMGVEKQTMHKERYEAYLLFSVIDRWISTLTHQPEGLSQETMELIRSWTLQHLYSYLINLSSDPVKAKTYIETILERNNQPL